MAEQTKVTTPEFRAAFVEVFEPKKGIGDTPKYSLVMLFDKKLITNDPVAKKKFLAMKALANAALAAEYDDESKRVAAKLPWRDGEEKKHLDGYAGCIFVPASSLYAPGLIDRNKNLITSKEAGPDGFYSGCYARATVHVYTFDKAGNHGVAFGLDNIQKLRDGTPFGGRVDAAEDFDDIEDGADAASEVNAEVDDLLA